MRTARLKASLERFIKDVWDHGDFNAAGRLLADRYTIHHDPGDPWEGRTLDLAGYIERVRLSRAPFPDQAFDIQHMCADGSAVMMTWLWRGTHLADLAGFPATRKQVRMSGATTYLFTSEDRLSGHWQITHRLGVWRQLSANTSAAP